MDYLQLRIEEIEHDRIFAYLLFFAGLVFFVGGVLETVITNENPDWFLFFPYKLSTHTYSQYMCAFLGLVMVFGGFGWLVLGIIFGISYWFDEKRYRTVKELKGCVNHLAGKMGFSEVDAIWCCEYLGRHWRELTPE